MTRVVAKVYGEWSTLVLNGIVLCVSQSPPARCARFHRKINHKIEHIFQVCSPLLLDAKILSQARARTRAGRRAQ